MIVTSLLMAVATPNPASLTAPRQAYAACLRQFEASQRSQKLTADNYQTAAHQACPSERAGFVKALVAYDTSMGTKRPSAEANAQLDIDDQIAGSVERYRDAVGPN